MDIRNTTQFANFIRSNGFQHLDGMFLEAANCMDNYSASCNCYKAADKKFIYDTCSKIYESAIKHLGHKFRNELLSKTSERQIAFYNDQGSLLIIVSR